MKIKYKLDEGAFPPVRAHRNDAGWDLISPIDELFEEGIRSVIDTGVHVEIPKGYVGIIKSRSSMMKRGIVTDGTIDSGYTGSIKVVLSDYGSIDGNFGYFNYFYRINRGEKIAQLVIMPIADIDEMVEVDELEDTERGEGGFGSTGR